MASKKKAVPEDDGKVKPSEVVPVISGGKLKSLMTEFRSAKRDMGKIAQELSTSIKGAKKNNHLHAGVFATICKLDRMEPEELRNWIDHFEHQFEVSGLKKRADSVMRMPLSDDEGDDDEGETNVSKFPAAAGNA